MPTCLYNLIFEPLVVMSCVLIPVNQITVVYFDAQAKTLTVCVATGMKYIEENVDAHNACKFREQMESKQCVQVNVTMPT